MRTSLLSGLALLLLPACDPDADKNGEIVVNADDSGDTGDSAVKPPDIILGDPYVVMVAATAPGSLGSNCSMDLSLTNVSDGTKAADLSLAAKGCDWTGADLTGGVQYRGSFSATSCKSGNDETYDVQTFSGQEGFMFVMWYTGVNIGYSQLEQGTEAGDFTGGEAHVTVSNSFPDGNVQSIASGLGVTATLESAAAAGNIYAITWTSELNVGEVLSAFTSQAGADFVSGEPTWIQKPSWWPKCG